VEYADEWGMLTANQITRKMVSDLLLKESQRLKRESKTNHKVNSFLRSLKSAFNHAIKTHDLNMRNPCQHVDFYSIEIKLKYIPTDKEIHAVRAKLSPSQQFLFDFVDQTGCRIMEAIRLREEDIDGVLITLYTRKSKNSDLTPRRIPNPDCLSEYCPCKNNKNEDSMMIFNEWDAYPRFLEETVKDLMETKEMINKWNWHNLRHRRASLWANNGMTTFEIMTRLGHSNLQTTMKYLQLLGFSRQ